MDRRVVHDAKLETLVAAQRVLGLTLTCPSTREDPIVFNLDGRRASVSDREAIESERERLVLEAQSLPSHVDPDFIDPRTVQPSELFIGRRSLECYRAEWMDSQVFRGDLEEGGLCRVPPMRINLRENFEPSVVKGVRRYAPKVQAALEEEIARQLRLKVIEECDDPPMQEVVMVRKEDAVSGFRFTLDARSVNAGMVVEPCNPPPIADVLRSMAGCRYLARLDLASAYWQFPLAEESRYLSAFRVGQRAYRYRVVYMGGMGASHHVQRSVQSVLKKHIGSAVQVYIDDVVVGTETHEEFVSVIHFVISAFRSVHLVCKITKCIIGCYSLRLLGHIVDDQKVRMADDKRDEVANLPFPENPKQLRAALGQTNFHWAFIPRYATITKVVRHRR